MSKPMVHARSSVKKHGGVVSDYIEIQEWFDQTKANVADVRHRAILHSAFGIFLCEQVFGREITNSDGKVVSVRDLGEQHVLEDLGFIPSIGQWLQEIPVRPWMAGRRGADRPQEAEARGPGPTVDEIAAYLQQCGIGSFHGTTDLAKGLAALYTRPHVPDDDDSER